MGKYIATGQILTALLVLASNVRLEKLAEDKYRVEAIFTATANYPRQAKTTLFTSREQAEAAYWHYLLEKTPLSKSPNNDTSTPSSAAR